MTAGMDGPHLARSRARNFSIDARPEVLDEHVEDGISRRAASSPRRCVEMSRARERLFEFQFMK